MKLVFLAKKEIYLFYLESWFFFDFCRGLKG